MHDTIIGNYCLGCHQPRDRCVCLQRDLEKMKEFMKMKKAVEDLNKEHPLINPVCDGWKSIASAPKDGTYILICGGDYSKPNNAWLGPQMVSWRTYHPNAQGKPTWRTVDGIKVGGLYWMPLPAPPKDSENAR